MSDKTEKKDSGLIAFVVIFLLSIFILLYLVTKSGLQKKKKKKTKKQKLEKKKGRLIDDLHSLAIEDDKLNASLVKAQKTEKLIIKRGRVLASLIATFIIIFAIYGVYEFSIYLKPSGSFSEVVSLFIALIVFLTLAWKAVSAIFRIKNNTLKEMVESIEERLKLWMYKKYAQEPELVNELKKRNEETKTRVQDVSIELNEVQSKLSQEESKGEDD